MSRVVLAMSGGVDSSVAAHLLLEQGHEVVGVFMRHGEESPVACATTQCTPLAPREDHHVERDEYTNPGRGLLPILQQRADHKQGCCSASDAEDARRVADRLDIPFYALNLQEEFQQIIDYFVDEYTQGRTPNPCVMCNNWLKFGKLFDYADSIGAEYVATGHYARLTSDVRSQRSDVRSQRSEVRSQRSEVRGQRSEVRGQKSEVRSQKSEVRSQKSEVRSQKSEVRGQKAEGRSEDGDSPSSFCLLTSNFAIHRGVDLDKDQSYVLFGIERELLPRMLLPVGGYTKPQIRQLAAKIGLRVAEKKDSQEICFVTSGKHDEFVQARAGHDRGGQIVTTDGQIVGEHHGIERFTVGQRKGLNVAMGERYFVVRIEPQTRQVVIGRREELGRSELTAQRTNWQVDPPVGEFRCLAKIRYNAQPCPATAATLPGQRLRVVFDEPRFGVAPGQAVVCYDGERMLGGGWIE